ncbi:MAG TPA: tetratricopeptide repeat protein [Burkholderiaceae bacterium]|nr:tetratricopeptide repeat protein [Burkholderiaceae bacterium]
MARALSIVLHLGRSVLAAAGLAATLAGTGPAFGQAASQACGSIANAFGPFDYRTERGQNLRLVEGAHFTASVESLVRGNTSVSPAGDLDYTLRAFPNHHRALMSAMRYGEKHKSPQPRDLRYSVECYFDRALRFRPDDSIVRMIFATFLSRNERNPEAIKQLEHATELAKDNPFTHYNIGLIYLEIKAYDKALVQAHKAYGLGFTQTALKDGLLAAGKWSEPPAQAAEGAKPDASPAQ